jgi:GTPase SAR1 family protein
MAERFTSTADPRFKPNNLNENMKAPPTFKVVIVGDCNVGKTCLIKRYIEGTFQQGEDATLGAQFYSKKIDAQVIMK